MVTDEMNFWDEPYKDLQFKYYKMGKLLLIADT